MDIQADRIRVASIASTPERVSIALEIGDLVLAFYVDRSHVMDAANAFGQIADVLAIEGRVVEHEAMEDGKMAVRS